MYSVCLIPKCFHPPKHTPLFVCSIQVYELSTLHIQIMCKLVVTNTNPVAIYLPTAPNPLVIVQDLPPCPEVLASECAVSERYKLLPANHMVANTVSKDKTTKFMMYLKYCPRSFSEPNRRQRPWKGTAEWDHRIRAIRLRSGQTRRC